MHPARETAVTGRPVSARPANAAEAADNLAPTTVRTGRPTVAKRRIAMISEHASPLATLGGTDAGGQNVYVEAVARRLAKAGDRVDVFTRRDRPRVAEVVEWRPGARTYHVPAGDPVDMPKEELLPLMPAFRDWMLGHMARQKHPYDLMHANFWMSGLVAADIKARTGIPYVVTFHALGRVRRQFQGGADRFPDERFEIEERVAREADLIIAECPQDARDLVDLYGANPERLRVVPCGYDPALFQPIDRREARRRLGLDPQERIVLQLGRLVPRKGVDNVISAIAVLRDRHDMFVRLLVVGGADRQPDPTHDPELARLMALVESLRLGDRVTFLGRRDRKELRDIYGAADIFVSTPWYEPFGITPVEAMACGVPVIGSAVGGIKSTVADGETGFLVPPRDPDALAARIARTFEQPGLLPVLGRLAERRASTLYTWDRVAKLLEAVYEEVLEPGRWRFTTHALATPRGGSHERSISPRAIAIPVEPGLSALRGRGGA
ncbi:MAG TPA: glycosyltransferase family 1 protein [Candidatus Limnocylindrales bacterium]